MSFAVLISMILILSAFYITSSKAEGGLVINEFMGDNDAKIPGPYMTFPDWIEIYNGGNSTIDLSGMCLTEDLANSPWRFPNGTILEPGGYLIVWGGRGSGPDMLHANFSPNAGGGTLTLLAIDGTTVIDQVTFDKQIRDVAYGRIPDGSSTWSYLINPTPSEANVANPQTGFSKDWPVWAFITSCLVICVLYVLVGTKKGWGRNEGQQ